MTAALQRQSSNKNRAGFTALCHLPLWRFACFTCEAPAHGAAACAAATLPGAAAPPEPSPNAAAAAAAAVKKAKAAGLPAARHLDVAGYRSLQCRQTDAVPAAAAAWPPAVRRLVVAVRCHCQSGQQAAAGAGGSVGAQVAAEMTARTGAAVLADCAPALPAAGSCDETEGIAAVANPAISGNTLSDARISSRFKGFRLSSVHICRQRLGQVLHSQRVMNGCTRHASKRTCRSPCWFCMTWSLASCCRVNCSTTGHISSVATTATRHCRGSMQPPPGSSADC